LRLIQKQREQAKGTVIFLYSFTAVVHTNIYLGHVCHTYEMA